MGRMPDTQRFAVVVCPRCRHAKGVDRDHATTTCPRCAARHEIATLRLLYTTGDAERLRLAVGLVAAQVAGGDAALVDIQRLEAEIEAAAPGARGTDTRPLADDDLVQYAASLAAGVESVAKKVARILDALDTARPDGFPVALVEASFEAAQLPVARADKEIRRALVMDELYEPRPGHLKLLR